jgi:menaquinone-dependent protoporphyrinogen oxidase
MKILIVYGTTEGQTRKIAKAAADQITEMGHEAVLHDATDLQQNLRPGQFDKIIVAGSVHNGQHQEALELFVFANRGVLDTIPSVFISVSMAAAFEDSIADAEGYVRDFRKSSGWNPTDHLLVAGAIRPGKYGYYEEITVRHRVLANRAMENPDADQEFTDWARLAGSIAKFVGGSGAEATSD